MSVTIDFQYIITQITQEKIDSAANNQEGWREKIAKGDFGTYFRFTVMGQYIHDPEGAYDEYRASQDVYITITSAGGSYLTVFAALSGEDDSWLNVTNVPLEKWVWKGRHDSVWRSDISKILHNVHVALKEKIRDQLPDNIDKGLAWRNTTIQVHPSFVDLGKEIILHQVKDPKAHPSGNGSRITGVWPADAENIPPKPER